MARMILLGVGTGIPDIDRDHTHMVWDGPGGPLLIDAGGSTYQRLLRAGIDPQTLQGIVLTHSHADHINGLFGLLFSLSLAGRRMSLPIYGLTTTLTLVQTILAAYSLDEHVAPVTWVSINAGDRLNLPHDTPWMVQTALNEHSRPCLALCFEQRDTGQTLVYSGDTEPCQAVRDLAMGADVLIHEATTAEPFAGHTTPRQAGEIGATTGVAHLVLVHFSPQWTMPEEQALADVRAGGFVGRVDIGQEYQVLELK